MSELIKGKGQQTFGFKERPLLVPWIVHFFHCCFHKLSVGAGMSLIKSILICRDKIT